MLKQVGQLARDESRGLAGLQINPAWVEVKDDWRKKGSFVILDTDRRSFQGPGGKDAAPRRGRTIIAGHKRLIASVLMKVAEFDYHLPEELIAQAPIEPRDASRLMVLHRNTGLLEHRVFRDVVDYLEPQDVLVLNDTRVIPARLLGTKRDTGARVEVLLLRRVSQDTWETLVKPGRRVRPGALLEFGEGRLMARVKDVTEAGGRLIEFKYSGVFESILDELGQMPLPPYIHSKLDDGERYQTVYARVEGSAAAPTAGLHFTPELLGTIAAKGVSICSITFAWL